MLAAVPWGAWQVTSPMGNRQPHYVLEWTIQGCEAQGGEGPLLVSPTCYNNHYRFSSLKQYRFIIL